MRIVMDRHEPRAAATAMFWLHFGCIDQDTSYLLPGKDSPMSAEWKTWMKQRALRPLQQESTVFYAYRWLAWILAAVVVLNPAIQPGISALSVSLLLLTCFLNIITTGFAGAYVQIARRRPWLLLFDVLASVSLLWLSAGTLLPFMPYALGALVLPTLLLGWRGSLVLAGSFALLDLLVLSMLHSPQTDEIALRTLVPLGFVLAVKLFNRLLHTSTGGGVTGLPGRSETRIESGAHTTLTQSGRYLANRLTTAQEPEQPFIRKATPIPTPAPLLSPRKPDASVSTESPNDTHRPTTSERNQMPHVEEELPLALRQLIRRFNEQESDLALDMAQQGTQQQLSRVQEVTLVKLAHEALRNVQQHAQAHSALLTLNYEMAAVTLMVQDDGVGLMDGTHERPGVHALRAMHYRMAELDGQLEVFEGESGGVVVRGWLPVRSG
jgi:hypothetical protein